jgi:prephenate dehydrogenase
MDLADEFSGDMAAAVKGSDLVVIATPVNTFESVLTSLSTLLEPGTIVTDVGSTKRTVCKLADRLLPKSVHFVGSHPMAGGERSGPDNARADLFVHAPVIITPYVQPVPASTGAAAAAVADRAGPATTAVAAMWEALHARVTFLDADTHDRLVASVSHLPHATASMLVTLQSLPALDLSGSGYRDATRIAAGDPDLWRDILIDNRDYVSAALRKLRAETDEFIRLLDTADGPALREYLASAAMKRGAPIRERPPMV